VREGPRNDGSATDGDGLVDGVRRIAVLRANALGDLVVALPALDALRAAYPAAEITLLGRAHHVALLGDGRGPVDRVVALPDGTVGDEAVREPGLDRDALLRDIASPGFDVALQMHGGGRNSNPLVRALGARVTAGSRTPDAPSLDRWVSYEAWQSEVARYLDVVSLVGARPVGVEPRLIVRDEDRTACAAELPHLGSGSYVVVHPGATDPRRRWPVASFVAAVRALAAARDELRFVVTGTAAEADLIAGVAAAVPDRTIVADRVSINALFGLLAGADLVLSNDTGPLHLAVAAGRPTVGLFWVGNLINAGPFSRRRHRALESWRLVCPVCGTDASAARCRHDPSFIADIPVAAVVDAATALLAS
jgi:ADP-heptose:LPS heptosyltransferase